MCNENKWCMNCAKYTLKNASTRTQTLQTRQIFKSKFAMSYFRQDLSPTSIFSNSGGDLRCRSFLHTCLLSHA
jgi:hypothetical protein